MLVLSLTVVVLIISVIVIILITKKIKKLEKEHNYNKIERLDRWYFSPIIIMTIFGIALGFELLFIPTENSIQESINQYNNLSEFIYCSGIDGVEEKVLEINDRIDRNRQYKDNIWIGIWYTEEYANLEKLNCVE